MKNKSLLTIILAIGLIWLKSSWGKLSSGNFPDKLGGTLTTFASKNPNLWFKSILETTAIPNSVIFGYLVMLGEFFVAVTLTVASLYLLKKQKTNSTLGIWLCLGLIGGALLNLTFWFAAGWMSPSTETLNLLMAGVQIIILVGIIKELT